MNKKFFATGIASMMFFSLFASFLQFANADSDTTSTNLSITNTAPVITTTPSDGGSDSTTPTNEGSNVNFTVTAKDINGESYYAIFCDSASTVTAVNNAPPTCSGTTYAVSGQTASGVEVSETYDTTGQSSESLDWVVFVCDHSGASKCSSANPGSALGYITLTSVPEDGDEIVIDSVTYEFDTAGDGITSGGTEVDTSSSNDVGQAAQALVDVEAGANSNMAVYGGEVWVYADATGTSGNSITITEADANEGGSTNDITINTSPLSQGNNSTASPFKVNHAPTYGAVYVNPTDATTYSDVNIDPNDTVYFNLKANGVAEGINDTDSDGGQDTVTVRICADGTGSYAACTGGAQICEHSDFDPSTVAFACNNATLAAAPYPHGTKNFEVYVQDNHGFAGTGTSAQSFNVTNTPPYLSGTGAYNDDDGDDMIQPGANGMETVQYTVTVKDDNGDDDITGVTASLYETVTHSLTNGMCGTASEEHCYEENDAGACTLTNDGGADINATAVCDFDVYFNAGGQLYCDDFSTTCNEDSDCSAIGDGVCDNNQPWHVHVNPSDESGAVTNLTDSGDISVDILSAVSVTQPSIAYGAVSIGQVSTEQTVTLENLGNQVFDLYISGTDMSDGGSNTINKNKQQWNDESGQGYSGTGANTLLGSASDGNEADNGCYNSSMAVRSVHDIASSDFNLYWLIEIPANQIAGTYNGTNTFTATDNGSCSG